MQVNLNKSILCAKRWNSSFFPSHRQDTAQLANTSKPSSRSHNRTASRKWGFLGTINFSKNHIPNHAEILQPIAKLTKKESHSPGGRGKQQLSTR
jgi:hypothetical protein